MSVPVKGPGSEDVLASIRRIVSEETSADRLRLTTEMETPGKLVLSPALRAGEAPNAGSAERGPAGGAPLMRLEKPVAGTGTALAPNATTGRSPETGVGNGRTRSPDRGEVPEAEFVHAEDGFPWTGEVLAFRSNSGSRAETAGAEAEADGSEARRDDIGRDAPAESRSREWYSRQGMKDPHPSGSSNESVGPRAEGGDAPRSPANSGEAAFGPSREQPEPLETKAPPFRSRERDAREMEPRQAERDRSAAQEEPETAIRDEQGRLLHRSDPIRSALRHDPAAERAAEGYGAGFADGEDRRARGETPRHAERPNAGGPAPEAPFRGDVDCRSDRDAAASEHARPARGLDKLFVPNEEALRALAARIIREELLGIPNERLEDDMRRIVRQEVRRALQDRYRN